MTKSDSFIQGQVNRSAFGLDLDVLDSEDIEGLSQAAKQVLGNPLLLQRLTDRVYQLMKDDLARQSERGFGGRSHDR